MVWKKAPAGGYYCRVTAEDGTTKVLPCGTSDKLVADDVEATANRLHARRRWALLNAVVHARPRRLTLAQVYDADVRGALDTLEASLTDVDVTPLVAEWAGRGRRGLVEDYLPIVRRFLPEGTPCPASTLTAGKVRRYVDGLAVSGSMKNKVRAAISAFCWWLVERELLPANPVRSTRGYTPNPPRAVFHTMAEAEALVAAITDPVAQALEALMAATAAEWQACQRARVRDLDVRGWTFYARGTKTKSRTRRIAVGAGDGVPQTLGRELAWARPILAAYVRDLLPTAPLFPITEKRALALHHAACRAARVRDSVLHDWRHTYAVRWLQLRGDIPALRRQLGHTLNSQQAETVYGVYAAELGYEDDAPAAPVPAPAASRRTRGHGA